jgi:propionyl-CoA carboxylase alpha chain
MNTRLQVEHPVTEMITGLDLVEEQIKIARGEKLGFAQEDLSINGHSLELRVYAEDPANDFLPSTGTLSKYIPPTGEGIRVDDGFEQGMAIPVYYDPMIAKLVVHAQDRAQAIQKMKSAIANYTIEGVSTTLPFGNFVMDHEAFVTGNFDTQFVEKYFSADKLKEAEKDEAQMAAIIALKYWMEKQERIRPVTSQPTSWTKRSLL